MPQEIIEGFRLSPQQKHLWPLRQSDHGPSYCTRCVVRIEGELDVEILQQAIRHVIGQHEILRTTFTATRHDDPGPGYIGSRRLLV